MPKKNIKDSPKDQLQFLSQITSGIELLNIANSFYGYQTYYEEADDFNDSECINEIIQNLVDYSDICGMIESYDKEKMGSELNAFIKDIEKKGYYLFGEKNIDKNHDPVLTIIIRKKINQHQPPY